MLNDVKGKLLLQPVDGGFVIHREGHEGAFGIKQGEVAGLAQALAGLTAGRTLPEQKKGFLKSFSGARKGEDVVALLFEKFDGTSFDFAMTTADAATLSSRIMEWATRPFRKQ